MNRNQKNNITATILAVLLTGGGIILARYYSGVSSGIFLVALAVLILTAWIMAGYAVAKSLIGVGAGLSLILYLAQAYCEVPQVARTGDDALKSLLIFGFLYIAVDFFCRLYREVVERSKILKEIDGYKRFWLVVIPFILFSILFTWEIYQIVAPITRNLCIYH